jgi:anti-anti-sigma factor
VSGELTEGQVRVATSSDLGSEVVVIELLGELDLALAPELRTQLVAAITADNATVVDLSEATFIDSSTIAAVTYGHQLAVAQGTPFVVQLATEAVVERVISLTGITETVPRVYSRADAIAFLRKPHLEIA